MLSIDHRKGLGRINVLIEFNNLLCSRIVATKSLYPITIFLISLFIGLVPIAAALEKSNFNTVMVQRKMDKRAIKNKLVQEQLFRPHPSSCRCEGIRAKKLWNG